LKVDRDAEATTAVNKMRRVVLVMLLAAMVSVCKTGGLVPSKFEGGRWSFAERLSDLVEFLVGGELGADAEQRALIERR
jgi:hypothetical protein